MEDSTSQSPPADRDGPDERHDLAGSAGALCDGLVAAEAIDRQQVVDAWIASLPSDSVRRDTLALALLDTCRLVADALHCGTLVRECRCHSVAWSSLAGLTAGGRYDLRAEFRAWARLFLAQFERDHPDQPVDRAAAFLRSSSTRRWPVAALAARSGTTPSRLRAAFHARFGMTPSSYLHLVRVTHALRLCGSRLKVESMAREVGYRSKKDLYAAMDRWVGVTPARLREWSADDRRTLEQRLRLLARRGAAEHPPGKFKDLGP
jgi:AraC-like DNA-binding protein